MSPTGRAGQKLKSYNKSVDILEQTFYNKPISGCVCMACDSLPTTTKSVATRQQTCYNLIVKTYCPHACCKLLQQVVTSL